MHASERKFQHKKPFQHAKRPDEHKPHVPMVGNNYVDYPSSSHYCKECKLPDKKKGCVMFA
jgi:hypothetical protein